MTTDLRFTLQLMDAVPELRMNGDLSHFVVGQEFAWPVGAEDHALIRRVLERADMFHGRVASREQVQIPITWEHHRPWLDLFLGWWEEGFRLWRARAGEQDELIFVCELGPPWYALTGAGRRGALRPLARGADPPRPRAGDLGSAGARSSPAEHMFERPGM